MEAAAKRSNNSSCCFAICSGFGPVALYLTRVTHYWNRSVNVYPYKDLISYVRYTYTYGTLNYRLVLFCFCTETSAIVDFHSKVIFSQQRELFRVILLVQTILKAEQLREQFTRADNEKKELARKLEEAQGRLEENELARKKLQGKLESLNRQLEEGQGDKERLVEQLESLRGQVRCSLLLIESVRVKLKC